MSQALWSQVDAYIGSTLLRDDPVLEAILARNAGAGLPAIDVSPAQGRLLHLLVRVAGARRILEIGTLGGYSAVCMARALPPGGTLVTIEHDPGHAEIARANFDAAGVADRIELHVGAALEVLPRIEANLAARFDFAFIDADKANNARYLDAAVRLSRPGAVVVLDNVVREGVVLDAASREPAVVGTRAAFDYVAQHPRLTATAVQTVGVKGHDGFLIALVD